MKLTAHSEPGSGKRLMIPLSEFSYAAYTIQIRQDFRCVLHASRPRAARNQPMWRRRIQQILNWLDRACGGAVAPIFKPAVPPISRPADGRETGAAADFELCRLADLEVRAPKPSA